MQDDIGGMGPQTQEEAPAPLPESTQKTPDRSVDSKKDRMFEDYFPPLDLGEEAKKEVAAWLIRDLKKCVQNVESARSNWALYRAVYALEYVEKFYPSMGLGANFSSGLVCERVLEGIDRLRMSIFAPQPWFCVNEKTSNVEDIEFIHRAEWFMQTVLECDLELEEVIGTEGMFEFLLDGSLILEADTMYEKIPQRSLETYISQNDLEKDMDKVIDEADYVRAQQALSEGRPARVLIEKDVVTKNGLQFFRVNKEDHLIPPNVMDDREIRFRARRMYLTENDMMLLSSDGVGWYDRKDVEDIVNIRNTRRRNYQAAKAGKGEEHAKDEVALQNIWDLCYDWQNEEDNLGGDLANAPYRNTFAVYRILCKYGYKTKSDPRGLIPKYVLIDVEPESKCILRARTYPHFKENPNYFHFKFGVKPRSYWGFGFGARLVNEDFLESNAVDLTLDGAAMAAFRPMLATHPDEGGYMPFKDGIGPFKIGYVRSPKDVQALEIPPPSPMLLNVLLPLTQNRAANRTSITPLMQGHTESSDPRSPAAKTNMLLQQANIGVEGIIKDWNRTWNRLCAFVGQATYEISVYNEDTEIEDHIVFPGTNPDLEKINRVTIQELARIAEFKWKSQAASEYINSQVREDMFMKQLQFFTPMLQGIAQFNPELYKKYFFRWMRLAGEVMEIRGFKYLIPSESEMIQMNPQQMGDMTQNMMTQLRSGQAPEVAPPPEEGATPEQTLAQVTGGEE
jgi:hypothetical protein